MITSLRQGWKVSFYLITLIGLIFSACDEQETYTYEEESYQEDYSDLEEYLEQEDYIYEEDEEQSLFDIEEIVYDEDLGFREDERTPPDPELASVADVGDVVSDQKWEEITKGVSFDRTMEQEPDDPPQPGEINPGLDIGEGFLKGLSTLAWILVIALIIGLLAWFIIRTKVDTSVNKVRDFTLTDELLAASKKELSDALTQNLTQKDYRAAIRYRFGQLLQEMRKGGLLIWVPGRTNGEYQSDLKDPFFEPFGVLAKAFSYAMYSGKEITSAHYEEFAREADAFLLLFSSNTPKSKDSVGVNPVQR